MAAFGVLPETGNTPRRSRRGAGGGEAIAFEPCTFTQLVDSRCLAGRHFRTVDLAPGPSIP